MSISGVSGSPEAYQQLQLALGAQQAASQQTTSAQVAVGQSAGHKPPAVQTAASVQGQGHHDPHHVGSSQSATLPPGVGAAGTSSAPGSTTALLNAVV